MINIKKMIAGVATFALLSGVAGCGAIGEASENSDEIKIGVLESNSGSISDVGQQKIAAAKLAIQEINDSGGLLGKKVTAVMPDAQSNNDVFAQMAKKLILDDKVDVIFGGDTSASREAIRPLMDKYKMLYFYNNMYEGGVADNNVFCTGATADQQIPPLVDGMMEKFGKKVYIIAADYNFGQISAEWVKKQVEKNGGEIVGTEMIPLTVSQYSSTIDRINKANPDILMTLLVGENQSAFYGQWAKERSKIIPMGSTTNVSQTYEHLRFPKPTMENMYLTASFMQEFGDKYPSAKKFTDAIMKINPKLPYVGSEADSEYNGIKLWANAVKKAGSTDREKVIKALETGVSNDGPMGTVSIDPATHQVTRNIYLAHTDENQAVVLDKEYKEVKPDWMTKDFGVDLTKNSINKVYTPAD